MLSFPRKLVIFSAACLVAALLFLATPAYSMSGPYTIIIGTSVTGRCYDETSGDLLFMMIKGPPLNDIYLVTHLRGSVTKHFLEIIQTIPGQENKDFDVVTVFYGKGLAVVPLVLYKNDCMVEWVLMAVEAFQRALPWRLNLGRPGRS